MADIKVPAWEDPQYMAVYQFHLKRLEEKEKKEERERKKAEKEAEEEEIDNIGGAVEAEEKKFELSSKSVFLTYPHTDDMKQEDILACLEERFPDTIKSYDIALEQHKDGENHIHALVEFKKKMRIRDPRAFDAYWYHPNIQSTKSKKAVKAYIYKGHGDFAPDVISNSHFDWSSGTNFKKKREDHIEYKRQLLLARWQDRATSIQMYGTQFALSFSIDNGNQPTKKRHFWIWGDASTGKSTEVIKNNFKTPQVKFFKPRGGDAREKCANAFERYNNERVIVWDDTEAALSKEVICTLHDIDDNDYGETPFKGRFKDPVFNKEMIMIVLANTYPGHHHMTDWRLEEWFMDRFTVIEVRKNEEGRGMIVSVQ